MSQGPVDTLYILSPGHSGSTLLNLILGSHSRSLAVSELTHLPKNIELNEACTCGAAIRDCAHWQRVSQCAAPKLGFDILREPRRLELGFIGAPHGTHRGSALYRAAWRARRMLVYASQWLNVPLPAFMRHRFSRGIEHRLALYDAVRAASGAAIVVDASKGYIPGIATYQARPGRTRLILLTRDGRAVFYSNLKRGFGRQYSLRAWRNYYLRGLPVIERRADPAHVLRVRYEDLAVHTEREVRRICDFAGLEYEPGMLDLAGKQQHVTSGNDMRLKAGTGIRLDTKWQSELKRPDLGFFEQRAGFINRRLGYE